MTDENDGTDARSEQLDDDVVPEDYPPERPYGVDERLTPAEEAAMHLTDDPPMGDGDGYVDD